MIAANNSTPSPAKPNKKRQRDLPAPIDPRSLPPAIIKPMGKSYCETCFRYKLDRYFSNKVAQMCDTCYEHQRQVAEIEAKDPDYDKKLAALNESLKKDIEEINLPRVAQILSEFWTQEGGAEVAVAKIRHNLDYLDNFKPGSAVAMNVRMGMLKLQVAWEAVQLARAKQEKIPSVMEAKDLIANSFKEFFGIATSKEPPIALAGLGATDQNTIDAIDIADARKTLAEMDFDDDDLALLLGNAAQDQAKTEH